MNVSSTFILLLFNYSLNVAVILIIETKKSRSKIIKHVFFNYKYQLISKAVLLK